MNHTVIFVTIPAYLTHVSFPLLTLCPLCVSPSLLCVLLPWLCTVALTLPGEQHSLVYRHGSGPQGHWGHPLQAPQFLQTCQSCELSFLGVVCSFLLFLAKHGVVGHLFVKGNRLEILFLAVPKQFSSLGRWAKLGLQYELPQRKPSLVGWSVRPILLISDEINDRWKWKKNDLWHQRRSQKWCIWFCLLGCVRHFPARKEKLTFWNWFLFLLVLCLYSVFCFYLCPLHSPALSTKLKYYATFAAITIQYQCI